MKLRERAEQAFEKVQPLLLHSSEFTALCWPGSSQTQLPPMFQCMAGAAVPNEDYRVSVALCSAGI